MSHYDNEKKFLRDTHMAVCRYAETELDALARRAILGLQRLPATGIYGDDYRFKSVWDEYCHDSQKGPAPALEWAWDQTIDSFVDHASEKLPHQVRLLVSIGALYDDDSSEESEVGIDTALIGRAVRGRIYRTAINRNMERFYPHDQYWNDDTY